MPGNECDLVEPVTGISYIRVEENGNYLTSSVTESHRINSPYILESEDKSFFDKLVGKFDAMKNRPINRKLFVETLLKYDIGSLLHGVFIAKGEITGGRLRVERAMSAFIEAHGVQTAASGGVKKDQVNPEKDEKKGLTAEKGFGHVPFHRDEFTAKEITAFFNIDLAQIRGYGLGDDVTNLLILLALFKVRALLDSDLRLRTACYLEVADDASLTATNVEFPLPALADIIADLPAAIDACKDKMTRETVIYVEKQAKKKASKIGAE